MSRSTMRTPDYRAQAQAHLAEPVLGAGFMSAAGRIDDIVASAVAGKVVYQVSPLAAWRWGRSGSRRRDATYQNWLVAVTEQAVHLFEFTPAGTDVVIQGPSLVWPRGSFRFGIERAGRLTQTVHFDFADGSRFDGEVYRGRAYDVLTLPLLGLLSAASAG